MSSPYPKLRMLIDGKWIGAEGRTTQPVIDPATEDVLGYLPHAAASDLDRALHAAEQSFRSWKRVPARKRGEILKMAASLIRERAEHITRLVTLEEGKPLAEARIETAMAADTLEWYAEEGRRAYGRIIPSAVGNNQLRVMQEPVGPVAAFAPWNFPVVNPARKIGAALAAGCSCIMKPPEEAPASALAIAEALVDAGLPDGVLSIVFGVPHEISTHLLRSPIIKKVSFTGSIPVGKQLMKMSAETMKRTTMELGGHAPVLVFDDVDVDSVLDLFLAAKFMNDGQVCVSPTRFYVQNRIFDRFVEGFAARAEALPVGPGTDERNRMGPLAHPKRIDAMAVLIEDAIRAGSRSCAGGERIGNRGYYWKPTVLANVPETARTMNEEPFGPLALINPVADEDEAVARANRLPFGLAAYVFSTNGARARAMGDGLEAGMVGINNFAISTPEAPFGGVKESGHGSENAIEGLQACLTTKLISEC
ncbi:NAD-dependent succinate-semialdehyde dehydrogenase [Pseudorhodoplanes sp.]|uniref:NAD-dependent succinate-semialdehyde dehydrogenase n=1 Tax=Pseudorhodoplanes sp. TaxID=1934341 RepID=UPI003D1237E0